MEMNAKNRYIQANILFSAMALLLLLLIPSDQKNAWLLGFSRSRFALLIVILFIVMAWSGLLLAYKRIHGVKRLFTQAGQSIQKRPQFFYWFLWIMAVAILGSWGTAYFYFPHFRSYLTRLSPLLLYFCFWLLWSIVNLHWVPSQKTSWTVFYLTISIPLIITYVAWADNHSINRNAMLKRSDQGAYLENTRTAYESNYRDGGDRNRMPLYSYVQALFLDPELPDEEAFLQGKYINIRLSVFLLFGIFLLLHHRLGLHLAYSLTTVIAFSVFIFKAGYFQVELMYYFMFFVMFLLMISFLERPTIVLGATTGIWTALTYLTKASVAPSLLAFNIIYFARHFMKNQASTIRVRFSTEILRKISIPFAIYLLSLFIVLLPYLLQNHRIYGRYFYNVNSTFYMWYDSWDEAKTGTIAHGDRSGWPVMPEKDIPSMSKYLSENSADDILKRITTGLQAQGEIVFNPYGKFNYLVVITFLAFSSILLSWPGIKVISKKYTHLICFTILFMIINLLSFAWFNPIASYYSPRLTYTIYIPYCFSMVIILASLSSDRETVGHRIPNPATVINTFSFILLGLILVDIILFIQTILQKGYFGK